MILIASPRFREHTPPPGHPERPERALVFDAITEEWRSRGGLVVAPRPATAEELCRVHDPAYVERIASTAGRAAALDPDTFTSPESFEIACLAAGAALQAVEQALDSREPALALVRPPGHHAEPARAMGFCLFNSASVAAAASLARGLARVAIVDIDVHHGNGTQATFYGDPRVLYVSTHQYPFYPGTGAADEVGRGAGAGFTVNVPLEAGATDQDYDRAYEWIERLLGRFVPELLIVSAGYDAHERDPLASMRMTTSGYAAVVARLARTACPQAYMTEGGYDLEALTSCLQATVAVLTGAQAPEVAQGTSPRAERALAAVRRAQGGHWGEI